MRKFSLLSLLLFSPFYLQGEEAAKTEKAATTTTPSTPSKAPKKKSPKYIYDETVHVPVDEAKWKQGYQKASDNGVAVTRYYTENETPQKWTALLNIQFQDKSLFKEKTAAALMIAEQEKSPLAKWKILHSTPDDILYERTFPTGEEEIVRIIVTKKGMHRIAFVKRGHIDEVEKKEWISRLTHSVIVHTN